LSFEQKIAHFYPFLSEEFLKNKHRHRPLILKNYDLNMK
jgi:hypothetical protein